MKWFRYISMVFCLSLTHFLYAQHNNKMEPTSATDGNVKIQKHPKVRNLRHDNRGKKLPGEAKVFKRQSGQRKEIYAQAPRTRTEPRASNENHGGKDVKPKRLPPGPKDVHSTRRLHQRSRHRGNRH